MRCKHTQPHHLTTPQVRATQKCLRTAGVGRRGVLCGPGPVATPAYAGRTSKRDLYVIGPVRRHTHRVNCDCVLGVQGTTRQRSQKGGANRDCESDPVDALSDVLTVNAATRNKIETNLMLRQCPRAPWLNLARAMEANTPRNAFRNRNVGLFAGGDSTVHLRSSHDGLWRRYNRIRTVGCDGGTHMRCGLPERTDVMLVVIVRNRLQVRPFSAREDC